MKCLAVERSIQLFLGRLFVFPLLTSRLLQHIRQLHVVSSPRAFDSIWDAGWRDCWGEMGAQLFQAHWETEAVCFWRAESKAWSTRAAHECPPAALLGCLCGNVVWKAGQFAPTALLEDAVAGQCRYKLVPLYTKWEQHKLPCFERNWLNISNTIANSTMTIDVIFVHKLHKNLLQSSPDVYYSARGLVFPFHLKWAIFFYNST